MDDAIIASIAVMEMMRMASMAAIHGVTKCNLPLMHPSSALWPQVKAALLLASHQWILFSTAVLFLTATPQWSPASGLKTRKNWCPWKRFTTMKVNAALLLPAYQQWTLFSTVVLWHSESVGQW
jgi:hypothetical protein